MTQIDKPEERELAYRESSQGRPHAWPESRPDRPLHETGRAR
jgi:hypothetical protein